MNTLLAIFAHPDDESFGPVAGTLAKYAAQGVRVHYVCATRGEAGEVDPEQLGTHPNLAHLRTTELFEAARIMGLAGVYFLGYRDSGMLGSSANDDPLSLHSTPLDEVAQRLAVYMRCVNPDVVITHDQYGWYGHPDHIKCYEATLRAFQLAYEVDLTDDEATLDAATHDTPPQPIPALYVASFPKWPVKLAARFLSLTGRDPRRRGQNQDIDLMKIASWQVPTTTKIRVARYRTVKYNAMACHRSQRPLTDSGNPLARAMLGYVERYETLHKLYPARPPRAPIETELG
jgi:LmbE family N-acetylglucosaminyl deacetylase